MKIKVLLLVFALVFTMIIPVQADTSILEKELPQTNESYGEYIISVKVSGVWNEVGSLNFGKYQTRQTIDLGEHLKDNNPIIKLEQKDGGSAYLDAVLLDESAAFKASNSNEKVLNKLSKEDLDVTPVDEEGIILEFESWDNGILTVVGRIEPVVISKEPLQFPAANNFKSKDDVKDFYSYNLNSNIRTIKVDGMLDEVKDMEPFVKEYRIPSSGHPAGNIYFWVMNDDNNLYVTMDTTPDNTFDGDKDYAKVYINTNSGIKEFKVSVPETTWGKSNFTYTDKVNYEHKVYEFAIPLSEIYEIENNNISIAFAAYGTMSYDINFDNPDIAYNPKENLYLSVYMAKLYYDGTIGTHIYSDIIDNDGTVLKAMIPIRVGEDIHCYNPTIVSYEENGDFLIVWEECITDFRGKLNACLVNVDKNSEQLHVGPVFSILDENEDYIEGSYPNLAYGGDDEFLLVWQQYDYENNMREIYGRLLNPNDLDGHGIFKINNSNFNSYLPSVCYNPEFDAYMVSWEFWNNADNDNEHYDIGAQVINSEGQLSSNYDFIVSTNQINNNVANVALNTSTNQFFITWASGNAYKEIMGQYYTLDESLKPIAIGEEILVTPGEFVHGYYPASFCDGKGNMLTVWYDDSLEEAFKYYERLQYINKDGKLVGSEFYPDEYNESYPMDNLNHFLISVSGDNKGRVITAYGYNNEEYYYKSSYDVNNLKGIRYLIFEKTIVEPKEPSLIFEPNSINQYVGDSFSVKINYFNGLTTTEVTNDVNITIDNPSIVTSSAINGTFVCTAVGNTILRTTHAGLEATATIKVREKTVSTGGGSSPVKTPIGEILVDKKVIKTLYKEDVTVKNNIYTLIAEKSGNNAKLWLDGSFYKELATEYPNRILNFVWERGTYTLPLRCNEVLDEIDGSAKKINILLEKIEDKKIKDAANLSASNMGAEIISDLIDFCVFVEKPNKNTEINSLDFYAEKTINKLNDIDEYISTAMKLVEDKEILTFAPSVFEKDYATIKYRGNGIFTVIENPQTFNDIDSHWAKFNIEKLASRNIAFGRQNKMFAPDDYVTRAEFAVMITRALGITEEEGTNDFKDVSNEWFAEDISTAFEAGLIKGRNDDKFYPNEKIKRKDMAVMINNALKFADKEIKISDTDKVLSMFNDCNIIDDYAKDSTAVCANAGIIMGRDTQDFDPNENATRAEASAIIERMLRYLDFMN